MPLRCLASGQNRWLRLWPSPLSLANHVGVVEDCGAFRCFVADCADGSIMSTSAPVATSPRCSVAKTWLISRQVSGFLVLGQDALLLKAGLTPRRAAAQLRNWLLEKLPLSSLWWHAVQCFFRDVGATGAWTGCRGFVFTPSLTLDATAGSSTFMGCKGCVLTLPRAKTAARRLLGASCVSCGVEESTGVPI